jgi:hypothetical protein
MPLPRAAPESNEERKAAKKGYFPSSMGLSFLVPKDTRSLTAIVRWGDYAQVEIMGRPMKGGNMDLAEYTTVLSRIADQMRRNRKAYDALDEQHLRFLRSGGLPTVGTMATLQAEYARLDQEYDSMREIRQTLVEHGADI